jgi:hypothetical protein
MTTALWRIATPIEAGAIHPIPQLGHRPPEPRCANDERPLFLLHRSHVLIDSVAAFANIRNRALPLRAQSSHSLQLQQKKALNDRYAGQTGSWPHWTRRY